MGKVLFVATVVKTHINTFHIPALKRFKELDWQTCVAASNDFRNKEDCYIPYCDCYYEIPFARNPFNPVNLKAFFMLRKAINEDRFNIIHCHTPVGAALTRLAAQKARKKCSKVFYTAHGFHFFKGAPLINWIVYYPIERFLAKKTDVLITINSEDYKIAKTFKAGKVVLLPGVGIDTKKYKFDIEKRAQIRKELGISNEQIMLLSVGELNKNKNHEMVIKALKGTNVVYVIAGEGKLGKRLESAAVHNNVDLRLLGYRNDVDALCSAADVFVLPSLREGLNVSLMEAMASERPVMGSRIRGNEDLIDRNGGFLFDPKSEKDIRIAINTMLSIRPSWESLGAYNRKKIEGYDTSIILNEMFDLYEKV